MSHTIICWKCKRSVTPAEKLERDPKTRKRWQITYCPFERCGANFDLEPYNIKVWNQYKGYFEDETDAPDSK